MKFHQKASPQGKPPGTVVYWPHGGENQEKREKKGRWGGVNLGTALYGYEKGWVEKTLPYRERQAKKEGREKTWNQKGDRTPGSRIKTKRGGSNTKKGPKEQEKGGILVEKVSKDWSATRYVEDQDRRWKKHAWGMISKLITTLPKRSASPVRRVVKIGLNSSAGKG